MRELICIRCPRGCHLSVDDNGNVSGNSCPLGKEYALEEVNDPKRMVTSFVRVSNRRDTMLSVRTSKPISKNLMFKVMDEINKVKVKAPVEIGKVLIKNIFDTGVDIIATNSID